MSQSIRVNQINRQTSFSAMDMQKWEILLFAEDIVSFLMNTKLMWKHSAFSSSKAAPRAGEYRDFVYNGFNEIVKKATYVLFDSMSNYVNRQFCKMMETSNVNDVCFKSYAKFLWEEKFSDGIDAIGFLRYCVVITGLAGAFYLEGVKRAPDYAVRIIVYHFPLADCLKVTWDVLNKASRHYLKVENVEMHSRDFAELDNDLSLNVDCNCFKNNINGPSFKKIYGIRGEILKFHLFICMGAKFTEAYEKKLIMRTDDYEKDDQTYISDESSKPDIYFREQQSSMSALLKISQAARNSEESSHTHDYKTSKKPKDTVYSNPGNHTNKTGALEISQAAKNFASSLDNQDYTTSRNLENVIHNNPNNHPDKSGVVKTSQSAEFSEKSSSSGTFLSSIVPKGANNDADSAIFKIPKSVKRFKMSHNENGSKSDQVVPRESVIVRNQFYQSDMFCIDKISEMVKNLR